MNVLEKISLFIFYFKNCTKQKEREKKSKMITSHLNYDWLYTRLILVFYWALNSNIIKYNKNRS
jgi:hypothetical protein